MFRPTSASASDALFDAFLDNSLLAVVIGHWDNNNNNNNKFAPPSGRNPYGSGLGETLKAAQAAALPIGVLYLSKPLRADMAHLRCARLGVSIAEKFRGRGYGREAVGWALDWAFGFAGLRRVELGCAEFNERAVGMFGGMGFRLEGRKREALFVAGEWFDLMEYGMLAREWEALRGAVDPRLMGGGDGDGGEVEGEGEGEGEGGEV
ncbi:acyl-CoA N-acyltransferase [Bombardia bombarda]|uniref:Acyl-CoA N-acyltransferase n=1 Tax=Bombardia bombarda TaxID=252184 RepID=A0AA40CA00_9PEZI|nr:acyl-CoA N-acyltransferase [Bombardia bombarda]